MIPDALTERFHHTLVRKNPSGHDYVSVDAYIDRLNTVLGHAWAWGINDWKLYPDAAPQTKNGKPQYLAVVQGTLTIILHDIGVTAIGEGENSFFTEQSAQVSRDGIGSNINFDPDTAVKSAQAEALKKACHQFGIALYLWKEAERDFIATQKQAVTSDAALKTLAVSYTQRTLDLDPTNVPDKDTIMETLDVTDFSVASIRARLEELGVL